jgi:hypothetical protein
MPRPRIIDTRTARYSNSVIVYIDREELS